MPELHLHEANELLSAWAQSVANGTGIRILQIKGKPLHTYQLRPLRHSADIDVLVAPLEFERFCATLLRVGWMEFPGSYATEHFTRHSRSFRRSGWPTSLDIHSYFPGFLNAPDDVFEILWARRKTMEFAHVECNVPDRMASLIILLLHSLRGSKRQDRHQEDLQFALAASLSGAERLDLTQLTVDTGAAAAVEGELESLGLTLSYKLNSAQIENFREWRRKVSEGAGLAAVSWLLLLRDVSWREKVAVVSHALWPSRKDLLIDHRETRDNVAGRLGARLRRLARGITRLRRAVRELRRR